MRSRFWIGLVLSAWALLASRRAGAAELGMLAPPLKISKWIKGAPVDLAAGKGTNIFVVEFWATWCGPCRITIPRLSEYQRRFKDQGVVIVGISTETAAEVVPFVNRQGDTMDYVVGLDDAQATAQAYMGAFGVPGIPHAFVVDQQGRIVWHGNPLEGLDQVLQAIVEGRYDVELVKRASLVRVSMEGYFRRLVATGDTNAVRELGDQILKDSQGIAPLLDQFAWIMLTHERIQVRDVALAKIAAEMAFKQTRGTNASVAETLARALFASGQPKEALGMQRKALENAANEVERRHFEKTLREYEAKQAE